MVLGGALLLPQNYTIPSTAPAGTEGFTRVPGRPPNEYLRQSVSAEPAQGSSASGPISGSRVYDCRQSERDGANFHAASANRAPTALVDNVHCAWCW